MSSVAQDLPYLILVDCIFRARELDSAEPRHGGRLVHWDSNETIRTMALVCRGWRDAGTFALFRSVAIFDPTSAQLFLRAVLARPALGEMVQSLAVGLGREAEARDDGFGQAENSATLVRVIQACPNLQHLHIRPLHASVRPLLLPRVRAHPLLSLVCAPSLVPMEGRIWDRNLFSSEFDLLLPTLKTLELDLHVFTSRFRVPLVEQLALVNLRIFADLDQACVLDIIRWASSTLEDVDIYAEHAFPMEEMTRAFMPAMASLRTLQFITNPPGEDLELLDPESPPIFDRLLPHFQRLNRLSVSASDISARLFRLLPPCLRHIQVQAFQSNNRFAFSPDIIAALEDDSINFTLQTLTVLDDPEAWGEATEAVYLACRRRGIALFFMEDGHMPVL